MAKYTETFMDWMENGNDFPSSFTSDTFPNLKSRFFARYCDHEIGFETEDLFRIKLEALADARIPLYESAVKALAASDASVQDPKKVTETKNGKTRGTTTDLPFDASTSLPSTIVTTDENTNTTTSSGFTLSEAMGLSDWNEKIRDMEDRLIDEFRVLFMRIY